MIFETYLFQLVTKSNTTEHDAIVIQKAHALTRHFIKRKLNFILPVQPIDHTGTLFDPHHHFNSIYITQNRDLLHLLPDFNSIYLRLRTEAKPQHVEDRFIDHPTVKDVQSFGNPPRKTHNTHNHQTVFNTRGYVRGGAIHSMRHDCESVDYCGPEGDFDETDVNAYLNLALQKKASVRLFISSRILLYGFRTFWKY